MNLGPSSVMASFPHGRAGEADYLPPVFLIE
jgi:hypothetical protein